ncbi:unnamed protein product [Rotaria sordida]|uniref:Uncharacterized protein n=1 Tax=Rotaria sordida TaxID=392033 RepID=A0A814MFL9_9BILA|nr:unnamed protein product [Rotaria sordida]
MNDIYSDQYQNEYENIELVSQLNENEKVKNENVNNLEELLRKSIRLNSSKCLRLIDEKVESLSIDKNQSIENLILSCNQIGISNRFNWTQLPKNLRSLELSGNFLSSINGIEKDNYQLESLALSFNQINQISDIFSNTKSANLCLIDLSYNMLSDLTQTIKSLKNLIKLRILYLHGKSNFVVLDDIRITAEERFRSRTYSICDRQEKDYALFQISFRTIENLPMPPTNQNEWPLQIHRYKMRLDWFEEKKQYLDIPFDKISNYKRFNQTHIQSSYADYNTNIQFSPNSLNLTINTIISFRDFLFHGTTCRFIHQMTEYWPPDQINQGNYQKTKPTSSKDKKSENPVKKKKIEDLSKLVRLKDPIETVLSEFNVQLRPFLDGDYQVNIEYKSPIEQQIDSINQTKSIKEKDVDKNDSNKDKKQHRSPSKSNQDKTNDQLKDKKQLNENQSEYDKNNLVQPIQSSILFQLHRFIAQQQII